VVLLLLLLEEEVAVLDDIGDSKPPKSTMEKKAESSATVTETSTLDPFIVKEISGVMGSLISCFFLSCLV